MKKLLLIITTLLVTNMVYAQLAVSFYSITNVSCYGGSNGGCGVQVTNGTAPYTYTWTPNNSNNSFLNNLYAGSYTVNVLDALGATGTGVINITEPNQLFTGSTINQVTCFGLCNGSATVIVNGGTVPYQYQWSNGSSLPTVTNLCQGLYQFNVIDAKGCTLTNTVFINSPTQITSVVTTTNASCGGACDGVIEISNVSGGAGAPYLYSLFGNFQSSPIFMNRCAGTTSVIIQDANVCNNYSVASIFSSNNSIPNVSITAIPVNESCYLSSNGAVNLNITGSNTGPFTYLWSNGATTQDIVNVNSGYYSVTISNGTNCAIAGASVQVNGTNCGTIQGNVFIDNDNNCSFNGTDVNYSNAMVNVNPGNRIGYTDLQGNYVVNNLPYGTYTVSLSSNNVNYIPNCVSSLTVAVNAGNPNAINNNFSAQYSGPTNPDVNVSAYSSGIVPGFNSCVNYYVNGLNAIASNGLVKAVLPSALIANFVSANPATYTISADTIMWNFNLTANYYNANYFTVCFLTPTNTPLGSTFTTCVMAQPTVTDVNPINNTFCYSRFVTGSFDPNDKTVSPVGVGVNGGILASEVDLTYLIRFQNTGTGPAVNIVVMDTLSANVNATSFKMINASHNYNIDVLPGNVLRWKFNNIMLADSNTNEPASHGFINYSIKRTNNNTVGTQIKNTAAIYFDFNEPVITNTALNTIMAPTSIFNSESVTANNFIIYPNPSNGIVTIGNLDAAAQIEIYNVIGEKVYTHKITKKLNLMVDLSALPNGTYIVKLLLNNSISTKKIIINK